MMEKENKKRKKHKKSLRQLERELGTLELIAAHAGVKMFKTAMKLEQKREIQPRYVR